MYRNFHTLIFGVSLKIGTAHLKILKNLDVLYLLLVSTNPSMLNSRSAEVEVAGNAA